MARIKEAIVILAVLLAVLSQLNAPLGMDTNQALILAITLVTLSLWGTGIVPGYVASTFLFAALILSDAATPEQVFASFSSSAIWLVVTGFVIGAAISATGLGARLGHVARPHLSRSYPTLIAGLMLLGMALGFVMPSSMGRAAVLVPVGMALADALDLTRGSSGRTVVAVIIAIGTNMPSFAILPSNIPNVILSGVAERSLGIHVSYMRYLLLHYPVLGVLKSLLIVGLVLAFFPARVSPAATAETGAPLRQVALLAILVATLALWSTDQLHGINPAWIGLGASLALMAAATSLFTTIAGVPAVLTPLAPDLARVTGFSLETVLMTQVIGFSSVLFPYQVGPLIVAMGLAGESTRPLLKVTVALFVLTLVLLLPLDFLWWTLLGAL